MLFKRKVPVQQYCTGSVRAAFEHSGADTAEAFKRICGDSVLNDVLPEAYAAHLRTAFIELMLIAIAKNCAIEKSLEATVFVHSHLKEINSPEIVELCHGYSEAFASSSTDGIRQMAQHFNKSVAGGRLRDETVERLNAEFYAILMSHYKDFKSIKLV